MMISAYFNLTGQGLPRKVDMKMGIDFAEPGILVNDLPTNSNKYKSGIRPNDIIILIDGEPIVSSSDYRKTVQQLRADKVYHITLKRGVELHEFKTRFEPAPKEQVDGLSISYEYLTTDYGYRLRTIISKPENTLEKLPAILFVQWLSCSSVENRGENHGFSNLIWGLSKKGYLIQRTEKPGVGDSNGPDCSELDFYTEVEIHRQALDQLRSRDDVDPDNIILVGGSMGSNIAAILASENPSVKALVFTGGYFKSWHERLLDFERRRLTYTSHDTGEVYEKMLLFSEFYAQYFNEHKTPGEILREKPYLKNIWEGAPDLQYGRPILFYQQANAMNMGNIWGSITQPTLALYGEFDWIMDREDHQNAINAIQNQKSKFVLLPRTDHNLYSYSDVDSKRSAFNNRSGTPNKQVAEIAWEWLKSL